MSFKIWTVLMFGTAIYPRSSAKFCTRSYLGGKWISEGDCEGPEMVSEIMKEIQLRAEDEKMKWTIFQRRKYGNVDFYRGWDEYVKGFGDSKGDFWLGLEAMHQMTKEGNMTLEIKMITRDGVHWVAKYSNFRVGPGSDKYRLHVSGYSGNATHDRLAYHNNRQFTTKDADHDSRSSGNCASFYQGAWWYSSCGGNLNGNFKETGYRGIWWDNRANLLRFSEMKFRKRL